MGANKTLLTSKTFKIDLHVHTCASKDSAVHPAQAINAAKRQGLDRICVTDHNRIDGALVAKEIDPELEIGAAYLEIPIFNSAEEFRAGLAESSVHGRLSPAWVHLVTLLNKWRGKFGLKPIIGHEPTTFRSAR
jgi:histidinol phosphatase-like PHP family hydrolase